MANQFVTAVKQRLTPQFQGPATPAATNSIVKPPKAELAPASLSLGEILQTGGSQYVADISTDYWFSALQPISPTAPSTYRPRQRAFLPGENLIWTPGEDKGGVTFETLRAMADGWDLLRLIIETRKDQLCRLKWEIRAKSQPSERVSDRKQRQLEDPNVKALIDFFSYPDGFHSWKNWLRMWMEDSITLDAAALWYERDPHGRVASIVPINGATINRVINDRGTTPQPPSVAYQQVVYGTPTCNLTTTDLLYAMRNERTHRRYGYSAVEQILVTIGIALRKQDFLVKYYTDGNIPEALCFLPSNVPVGRIKEIQDWFDSILAGDLSNRRRLRFLPGYGTGAGGNGVAPNVVFPKEVLLKDELDDWLLRIACFAFSVSPQNLMKQMNRASAQQAQEVAIAEGLEPVAEFVYDVCNAIIREVGMSDGYEFAWQETRTVDELKQAQIDNLMAPRFYSVNEVREKRGDDPRPEPEANMLGVYTPTGFIPISPPEQDTNPVVQDKEKKNKRRMVDLSDEENDQHADNKPNQQTKVSLIEPGQYKHPIYGDLTKLDNFFAYDPTSDTILVKGNVDTDEAIAQLGLEYE